MFFPQLQGFLSSRRQKQQQFPQQGMAQQPAQGITALQGGGWGQQPTPSSGQMTSFQAPAPQQPGMAKQAAYNQAQSDLNRSPIGGKRNRRGF